MKTALFKKGKRNIRKVCLMCQEHHTDPRKLKGIVEGVLDSFKERYRCLGMPDLLWQSLKERVSERCLNNFDPGKGQSFQHYAASWLKHDLYRMFLAGEESRNVK